MASEHFQVLNEKEELLDGVIETANTRKRQPLVVIMNGFLDTKDTVFKRKLSALFQAEGYVVVRFDYTHGFGSGSGDPSRFTLSGAVRDTEQVIEYASRRGYVDDAKVAVIGHSFGAMAAILLSAFDPRVKAVIAISSPYNFLETRVTRMPEREMARVKLKRYFHLHSETLGEEVRIDFTFFEDGLKKDMARAVRNLRQPTLIIHGRKDESIPLAEAEEIHMRIPGPKELQIIETMGHNVDTKDMKVVFPLMRDFLKRGLK